MWELWDRLTEYYGSAFLSQYGEEPNATWAFELEGLNEEQFRRGFELLKTRESAFPPNPGEFINLISQDCQWERRCHKVWTPENKLENLTSKEANKKIGNEALSTMKGLFG